MKRPLAAPLLTSQIVIAAAMTGIIWFVQRITYPQFLQADPESFPAFHATYTSALAPIVAPLMIAELALALVSPVVLWKTGQRPLLVVCSGLAIALWVMTFLVQVPLHDTLAEGWSEPAIRSLVDSNWWRTILWTARLALLLLLAGRLRPDQRC